MQKWNDKISKYLHRRAIGFRKVLILSLILFGPFDIAKFNSANAHPVLIYAIIVDLGVAGAIRYTFRVVVREGIKRIAGRAMKNKEGEKAAYDSSDSDDSDRKKDCEHIVLASREKKEKKSTGFRSEVVADNEAAADLLAHQKAMEWCLSLPEIKQ